MSGGPQKSARHLLRQSTLSVYPSDAVAQPSLTVMRMLEVPLTDVPLKVNSSFVAEGVNHAGRP